MESKKVIADEKVELGNSKDALRVLESRASPDRSTTSSSIEGQQHVQGKTATTSVKL